MLELTITVFLFFLTVSNFGIVYLTIMLPYLLILPSCPLEVMFSGCIYQICLIATYASLCSCIKFPPKYKYQSIVTRLAGSACRARDRHCSEQPVLPSVTCNWQQPSLPEQQATRHACQSSKLLDMRARAAQLSS